MKCRHPNSRFLAVDGINFHYLDFPAPGPQVLLLHGLGSSTYTWEETAPRLQAAGFHVYALDLKGSGGSDKPPGADYDLFTLRDEIDCWLEALGLRQVIFVGNSLGGSLGLLLALKKPDRINRLVLIAAAAYLRKLPWVFRLARLPLARALSRWLFRHGLIRLALRQAFYHPERVSAERVAAYYERLREPGGLEAQIDLIRGLDLERLNRYNDQLPTIAVPTLLLWGENDPWTPLAIGRRLAQDLPRATLQIIPRCGHAPQEELPDDTARLILQFLNSPANST
ncbi:MAG: alpha/beta hydrolase [Desulfobacterota bacterium]|jgi:pimeloyl-ACP methyl ester carboxylesterase|nr:alpha/beta hydrolase [Thermodesulfobacteriota bacterium]